MNNELPVISWIQFADGAIRPVYEDIGKGQFVIGDEGERVYGVWFIPPDEPDLPIIVQGGKW